MPDLIYRLFGARINRQFAAMQLRPKGFDGMILAFRAPDGKAYYTWSDLSDLPAIRTKQLERTMIWMDARTTGKTLEEYGEDQAKALAAICAEPDKQKRWTAATRLGALYAELILRGSNVIPEDLYYDLAATLAIAEDEAPSTFDGTLHQAKMDLFKSAARSGSAFFLTLPILKSLLGSLLSSEAGFRELLISWMIQEGRAKTAREVLS